MTVINQGVVTCLGCDISNVQGVQIDARGLDFVAAKATQGLTFNDRLFGINRALAAKNNQLFVGYHFLERGNGAAQAQHFVNFVNQHGGFTGIGAAVDVEKQNSTFGPTLSDVAAFVTEFNRLVPGKQLILYTGGWYWRGYLGNPTAFANLPLWDSSYIRGKGSAQQLIGGVTPNWFVAYGGWRHHSIRQFSSSGVVNGHYPIDLDEFEGTVAQLAALLHTSYKPPVVHDPVVHRDPTTHLVVDGVFGAHTISALQRILISHGLLKIADGIFGFHTKCALQEYLKQKKYYYGAIDGLIGDHSITALRKYLAHIGYTRFMNMKAMTYWGSGVTEALQSAINGGKF